ncbi:TetR/AcrR family transcriptional regulator [uncultured Friedmanniella sp.]|uniref:TetR/AcrR family transcriptional regulator n=1 Tax=uncultured Friedmanniella sp. TaxID=335381 RepID=UPI0035CBCE7E
MTPEVAAREHGRDRRKRLTRASLRRAVLELGLEYGLASVSVEAIAERAGVSTRTFFNYFESKEESALLPLFQLGDPQLEALRQGPPELAWPDLTELFADDLDRAVEDEAFLGFLQLQEHNPGLAGRQLATFARFEARISGALVTRLGDAPDARVRAPLMVGCCFTAVRIALGSWTQEGRSGPVRPHLERALSVVEPAFTAP